MLGNSCTNECPSDLYKTDYSTYKWVKNDYYDAAAVSANTAWQTSSLFSKDNLSMTVSLNGASSTIMISASGILHMEITNKRGSINYHKFTQIEPTPDPNDPLTNIFPLISGSTNQYLNDTDSVDLYSNALNNYPQGTNFKVKAEVHNDWGDKAIEYINFSLSTSPTIGDAVISCTSSPWKVKESMTISLTGNWYSSQSYVMELYIKVEFKFSDGTQILIIPEQWQVKTFTFVVPVISTQSNSNIPVSWLITATNINDKAATLSKSIIIDNTLSYNYRSTMYSLGVDYSSIENIVLLGSQMKQTLNTPNNWLQNNDLCQRDQDCFNQGVWIKQRNGNQWDCSEGYSGIDWSIDSHEFSVSKNNVNIALKYLIKYLTTNSLNGRSKMEMKVTALSYVTLRPEYIDYENIIPLTQIIESISNLDDSTLLSLPDEFILTYLNLASSFLGRIKYEINVKMKNYNVTEYYSSISQLTYSSKISKMKVYWSNVWIAVEKFLARISTIATSSSKLEFKYKEIFSGLFKIEYKQAGAINGTT